MFPGAAMEVSRSGTGVHIIGSGAAAVPANHGCKVGGLEFYTRGRYVALTGTAKQGSALADCSAALPAFVERYRFNEVRDRDRVQWVQHSQPAAEWCGPQDDKMLIAAALAADGSFGTMYGAKAHFRDYWTMNQAALALQHPLRKGDRKDGLLFDHSDADMAFMGHLAFWTGRDAPRMKRLFELSPLAQRKKWRDRSDYQESTIGTAIKNKSVVYDRDHHKKLTQVIGADNAEAPIALIMTLDEMLRDLVYIGSTKEVIHSKLGRQRSWDAALGEYAASAYEIEDPETLKRKVHKCLPAWRAHPGRRSFDVLTWAPERPEQCSPPGETGGGGRAWNIWRGLHEPDAPLDWQRHIGPFVEHLEYLVPIEAERRRFTQWLAHIIQAPGTLPHTAYVMIATTHVIGRNWLSSVLARVLRGHVACSVDLGAILESDFNGALSQKLLAVVDEAHEGMDGASRWKHGKTLRRIITQDVALINPKYGHQREEHNCCRWLMFSNFETALPIEREDRRFHYIQNPAKRQSSEYYRYIYNILHDAQFIASVFRYLGTFDLAGFNPGAHAVTNDLKSRAIEAGSSMLDLALRDFKDEYQGQLAPRHTLKDYLEKEYALKVGDVQLNHAISRAGMQNANRVKVDGQWLSIVIVRGVSREKLKVILPQNVKVQANADWNAFRPELGFFGWAPPGNFSNTTHYQ